MADTTTPIHGFRKAPTPSLVDKIEAALPAEVRAEVQDRTTRQIALCRSIEQAFRDTGRALPKHDLAMGAAGTIVEYGNDLNIALGSCRVDGSWDVHGVLLAYAAALEEIAEPSKRIERLTCDAEEQERWAASADDEAVYRDGCVATRTRRGDHDGAAADKVRAQAQRAFAKQCREKALAYRAEAAALARRAA